jgi:gamma-glutamyltranspeptidase
MSVFVKILLIREGMQHSGIGGGGFMLVRDSDGNYKAIGETGDGIWCRASC